MRWECRSGLGYKTQGSPPARAGRRARPDLVRRPVVDAQHRRTPPNIDAQRFPGERLLKNPLAQVACEEEAIRAARPDSRQKSQLRDTGILGLIDHSEFEWRMGAFPELRRHLAEHVRPGNQTSRLECGAHALENRPQHNSLSFLQSRLAAQDRKST